LVQQASYAVASFVRKNENNAFVLGRPSGRLFFLPNQPWSSSIFAKMEHGASQLPDKQNILLCSVRGMAGIYRYGLDRIADAGLFRAA
jgi:hypothetical protein